MIKDNYRQVYSWTKILEKIVENITPDIAKECVDFCFAAIRFNIARMQSDRERALVPKFAKTLEYVKQVKSGGVPTISYAKKDNYEQLFVWTETLDDIAKNLELDILKECESFCVAIIKANIAKMQSDQERTLAYKFMEIIEKIQSYNPYIAHLGTSNSIPDQIEKAQPPIPKIIHYCWLSNDPIPEKLQQYMKSWREKLPDYEFVLWNFDRFDIDDSQWVKQAFEAKKYAFAADYIRLYAVYNYGGIYLDMDVEVIKPFDDLLFADCMIAREPDYRIMWLEAGCFGAVKGHPFIRQCLEFYRNRNFNSNIIGRYLLPIIMGEILTAYFKDAITVLAPDYFTAKSPLTGIITKTENTRAIHHFASAWAQPEALLPRTMRWKYLPHVSSVEMDNAIALIDPANKLNLEYITGDIAKRICLSETYDKNTFPGNENIFDDIYRNNYWGSGESRSGVGSELNSTEKLREFLPYIWKKYQIKTVLDVPCGDYNWMRTVRKTGIDYIGGDIVSECIKSNNKQYQEENVSFRVIDIVKDELPKSDMIICKDCLQHLSNEDVWETLNNFKKSGSTWLLTTSYPLTLRNWDIKNGDYRPLNLLAKPFNFNNYLEKIHENTCGRSEPDKMMFLYRLEDLKLEPPAFL